MLRRPSRQGLLPVCIPGTTGIPDLCSHPRKKETSFTSPITSCMLVFILLTSVFISGAQDLNEEVLRYFSQVRSGNYPATLHSIAGAINENEAMDILQPFLNDSSMAVREKAYEMVYAVSSQSDNSTLRNAGVVILINACHDREAGIRAMVLELLTAFRKTDFNEAAKDSLRTLIKSGATPSERFIKLAGSLELTDLLSFIRAWSQPGNPPPLRWSALQSLARMGQPYALADMMERVKRLPVNDDLVYRIFPDLLYTRQPEAIAYIVEALQSDEKNCISADTEREIPIPCGYRIMEQLAPVIEGFPLSLDESGDLKTEDYPATLERVRQWFRKNKTYTIMNDRY